MSILDALVFQTFGISYRGIILRLVSKFALFLLCFYNAEWQTTLNTLCANKAAVLLQWPNRVAAHGVRDLPICSAQSYPKVFTSGFISVGAENCHNNPFAFVIALVISFRMLLYTVCLFNVDGLGAHCRDKVCPFWSVMGGCSETRFMSSTSRLQPRDKMWFN